MSTIVGLRRADPSASATAGAARNARHGGRRPGVPRGRILVLTLGSVLAVSVVAAPICAPATLDAARGPASTSPADRGAARRYGVGILVLRIVDRSRTVRLPDGRTEPRTLLTYVRYPALGPTRSIDVPGAPPARADGPFPLLVFAHGFAVTPRTYARLLQAWTQAGYVVAAPVFPLENANAPGGPDASDQINEPTDMSVVISHVLRASRASAGPLASLVDSESIAVAGQSDGGEAALAVADSQTFRDTRVHAAIILSGAEMSGAGEFSFAPGSPALLAAQGTADTTNEPRYTYEYFDAARRPKFLLQLLGAGHLPPYTDQQPQLGIVASTTIAFMDTYLKHARGALRRLVSAGNVPKVATLRADP